jgi:hypothetical protein
MAIHRYDRESEEIVANRNIYSQFNPRKKLDISDGNWNAMIINNHYTYLEMKSDLKFRRRYKKKTNIVQISKIEDNGGGKLKVTTENSHGYSNDDYVVLGGFDYKDLNVLGQVSSVTDTTFEITTISWSSDYSDETGYVCSVTDSIDGDELPISALNSFTDNISWGELEDYSPEVWDEEGITYGEDAVLVLFVKPASSESDKYLYVTER